MKGIIFTEIKAMISIFIIVLFIAGCMHIFQIDFSDMNALFESLYDKIIGW